MPRVIDAGLNRGPSMSMQNSGKLVSNSVSNKPQNDITNLTVRTLPTPPEPPEEPDMNAVYSKAYEGKVDDLIKLLAKVAGSKDGAKIIKTFLVLKVKMRSKIYKSIQKLSSKVF